MKCIRTHTDNVKLQRCRAYLDGYAAELDKRADEMRLIGNPMRLRILLLFSRESDLCVCDVSDILSLSVSAVSQHLKKLKDGGLIRARKVGQTVYYDIVPAYTPFIQAQLRMFEEYLEEAVCL